MPRKLLKKVLKEFIYGGHLLSLGAASIVWSTLILLNQDVAKAWPILFLAYLTSQIVYNHDHLDEINDEFANAERSKHLRETRNYQIVSLVVYILFFVIASLFTTLRAALLGLFIVFGGIFYTKRAKKFTKKIPAFKNFYIAFFWSILAFFVPFHLDYPSLQITILAVVVFIFARWVLNTVFFDLKDAGDDKKKGLKTLPAIYGFNKTILYLRFVNIVSGLIVIVSVLSETLPVFALALLVFPFYSFYYLNKSKNMSEQHLRMISYIMVDGEYLFWPFVLLLSEAIFS